MVEIDIYYEDESEDLQVTQALINPKSVCSVEEVDEYDGLYFLVMPWGKGYMVDSDTKHMLFK